MTQREVCKYLYDIAQACEALARFAAERTFDDYKADELLRSGVERQLITIGEALHQALRLEPALADHIAQTEDIIAFRNRLVHGYDVVSDELVWSILRGEVPALHREVRTLLGGDDVAHGD